jgi:hypothetical protein
LNAEPAGAGATDRFGVVRLPQSPLLGKFRVHAALRRLAIFLSPRTCGRLLALIRKLYGLPKFARPLLQLRHHRQDHRAALRAAVEGFADRLLGPLHQVADLGLALLTALQGAATFLYNSLQGWICMGFTPDPENGRQETIVAPVDRELLERLARKYVWWKTPDEALAMPERVVAQAMNIGDYDDVQALAETVGDDYLREVLRRAEAGQFSARSWAYWHYRLGLAKPGQVPALPARRVG